MSIFQRFYKILTLVTVVAFFDFSLFQDTIVSVCALSGDENLFVKPNLNTEDDIGPVLHAWCWKFKDVSRYINEISHAGFKSVQISPVQPAKKTIDELNFKQKRLCTWWSLYQPLDFSVGNYLGTKEDLKEMCDTAHKVGIRIIVDVVVNHLAEREDDDPKEQRWSSKISDNVITKVGKGSVEDLFHIERFEGDDFDPNLKRRKMTHDRLLNLPDLNTGKSELQNVVIGFLRGLIDLGADGFRFDAAKHIELPEDEELIKSEFWPVIISAVRDKKSDLFVYGEVLHDYNESNIRIGGKSVEQAYLKYMNITDNQMGDSICNAVRERNAELIHIGYCGGRVEMYPGNLVTWVESHDNYCYGSTKDLDFNGIKLGWAIVASRASSVPLYLARPIGKMNCLDGSIMCGPGDLWWKDPTIAEINKFRTLSRGEDEYIIKHEDVVVILRSHLGMVIVNFGREKINFNLNLLENIKGDMLDKILTPFLGLDFTDSISNLCFKVDSDANLRGTIREGSVAILYPNGENPDIYVVCGRKYGESIHLKVDWRFNCKVSYFLDDNESSEYVLNKCGREEEHEIIIGQGLEVGKETVLSLKAHLEFNGKEKEHIKKYIFTKCSSCEALVKVKKIKKGNEIDRNKVYCLYYYALDNKGVPVVPLGVTWVNAIPMEDDEVENEYVCHKVNGNQQVIIQYFNKGFDRNKEPIPQFPACMCPGIIVHPGEVVRIDIESESVQVEDLPDTSNTQMAFSPIADVGLLRERQFIKEITPTLNLSEREKVKIEDDVGES